MLSIIRLYLGILMPNSCVNTFWGRGVSQGHSEALRRINGVIDAVEYTVPREDALTLASLVGHKLDDVDRHRRVCYILAEKGKEDFIREEVLGMPNYFKGYETEIHFVDRADFEYHTVCKSHRGRVYTLSSSGIYRENKHSAFFDIELGSNPELTAYTALVGARACMRLARSEHYGAYTIFDIAPSVLLDNEASYNTYL